MLYTEREIGLDINGHYGQGQALGKVQERKVFALISVSSIRGEIDKLLTIESNRLGTVLAHKEFGCFPVS